MRPLQVNEIMVADTIHGRYLEVGGLVVTEGCQQLVRIMGAYLGSRGTEQRTTKVESQQIYSTQRCMTSWCGAQF